MNLSNYEEALTEEVGFNLKTKSLASIIKGNLKGFNGIKTVLIEFGETPDTADVWAAMLLNYRLNGSYPNLGVSLFPRVNFLINDRTDFNKRKSGFTHFKRTVKPETYNRWAKALSVIKRVANDEKRTLNADKSDEVRDLTLAEIQRLLGYKIRIVA